MISPIYIIAALVSLTAAQYVQLIENGPTLTTTDVNARLAPRRFAAQWCDKDDLYVYGGDTGSAAGRVRDMWKFEGDTRRWLWFPDGPGPVGRSEMSYWNLYGRFWLYGGRSDAGSVLSDLWSYTLVDRVWHASSVAPAGPGPVYGGISWVDPLTNRLFIYAGRTSTAEENNNSLTTVWSYDVVSDAWNSHPGQPPAIGYGAQTAQVEDQVYVLTAAGDFWALATETLEWTALNMLNGPTRRGAGQFFPIATRSQLLLFGGFHGSQMYRDMWRYDPDTKVWTELNDQTRPSARFGGSLCTDSLGASYMIGGSYNDQANNDVWRYGSKSTIHDLVKSIEFNLDSATLSALCGAIMSTLCFLFMLGVAIALCVRRCRERRKNQRLPMVGRQQEDDHDFPDL